MSTVPAIVFASSLKVHCMTEYQATPADRAADSIGELLPDRAARGERARAAPRQGIDPAAASGVGGNPPARQQTGLLKPMQRGIDRALGQIEGLVTPAFDRLDHRVAVRRARRQGR